MPRQASSDLYTSRPGRLAVYINMEPVSYSTECSYNEMAFQAYLSKDILAQTFFSGMEDSELRDLQVDELRAAYLRRTRCHNDPVQFYTEQQHAQLVLVESALSAEFGAATAPHPLDADGEAIRLVGEVAIIEEFPEYGEHMAIVTLPAGRSIVDLDVEIQHVFSRVVSCLAAAGLGDDMSFRVDGQAIRYAHATADIRRGQHGRQSISAADHRSPQPIERIKERK